MFKSLKIIDIEILLNEIDDLLARLEDYIHDKDGEDITEMRLKISELLLKLLED